MPRINIDTNQSKAPIDLCGCNGSRARSDCAAGCWDATVSELGQSRWKKAPKTGEEDTPVFFFFFFFLRMSGGR